LNVLLTTKEADAGAEERVYGLGGDDENVGAALSRGG